MSDGDRKWCECHLNNGMVCEHYARPRSRFSPGYCLSCGHDRECHELRKDDEPAEGEAT